MIIEVVCSGECRLYSTGVVVSGTSRKKETSLLRGYLAGKFMESDSRLGLN
jgi:hypothetical protein